MARFRLLSVALAFACLTPAGCNNPGASRGNLDLGPVPDFALTDQNGQPFGRKDLEGQVWVASFLFTRCATLCPQVAATLAQLQKDPPDGVTLVSFTVDPEHDTPAVLKAYAERYGADPARWRFLTGDQETVYRLVREGFLLAVEQNRGTARTAGNEVTHSSRLVVVDRRGHVRGHFEGRQVDEQGRTVSELTQLRQRLAALVREKP